MGISKIILFIFAFYKTINTDKINSMIENYVFTGYGNSYGKYKITNSDIEDAIDKGFLGGFSKEKIIASKRYQDFCRENGETSPFNYFAGHIMGFYERHHVAPFPPTKKKLHYAETSLGLAVRAIDDALSDARLHPSKIDAWFISTVSPHEQAPGIATTVKAYFTKFENQTPCFSLASGCSGFNINLQRAVEFFKTNPDAEHIVVAHTETMSTFLRQRIKFTPFVTFGDAAAAVIISKVRDNVKYGIIDIVNLHDLYMLDYVGVDENDNLYMDDGLIKDRAIINIPYASEKCLENSGLQINDVDLLVPHQTGNVILLQAAEKIGVPIEKVYLEGQKKYGNVSGATVPICFSLLNKNNQLKDGMKILSPTAGVGGTYGAFTYLVKNNENKPEKYYKYKNDLKDKTVLVLGASGSIGMDICEELQNRSANLILHANQNIANIDKISTAKLYSCDFSSDNQVNNFINEILSKHKSIDYVINAASNLDKNIAYHVDFLSPAKIIKSILPIIKNGILQVGTATEELSFYDFDEWISANRSMHGFLASASGEFLKYGISTIYFIPGFTNNGISCQFDPKQLFKFMQNSGQDEFLTSSFIAKNIVKSLYLPKVLNTANQAPAQYENAMKIRRLGYKLEVDV